MTEATALPTEPQPLPNLIRTLKVMLFVLESIWMGEGLGTPVAQGSAGMISDTDTA